MEKGRGIFECVLNEVRLYCARLVVKELQIQIASNGFCFLWSCFSEGGIGLLLLLFSLFLMIDVWFYFKSGISSLSLSDLMWVRLHFVQMGLKAQSDEVLCSDGASDLNHVRVEWNQLWCFGKRNLIIFSEWLDIDLEKIIIKFNLRSILENVFSMRIRFFGRICLLAFNCSRVHSNEIGSFSKYWTLISEFDGNWKGVVGIDIFVLWYFQLVLPLAMEFF